jgi:hypothetical protein
MIYCNTRDDSGNPVAIGLYFVRLKAKDYVKMVKMVLFC